MISVTSVIATNQVISHPHGHDEVIADSCLESMARGLNTSGGIPLLVEHDWTRPIGWSARAWTEREGHVLRLCKEGLIPETEAEWRALSRRLSAFQSGQLAARSEKYRSELPRFAPEATSLVCDSCCVYFASTGIVEREIPRVYAACDKAGLLKLKEGAVVCDGWVKHGEYVLAPHPFLRPSFSLPNPPNRDFIRSLADAQERNTHLDVRLRPDLNLLGLRDSLTSFEQRALWWGPPFKGNPNDHPYAVTVHGPTKYDMLNRLKRSEFWWYGKEERTFEMEELLDTPMRELTRNAGQRGMRFVHSIFDRRTGRPRHLDGAIRVYNEHAWDRRLRDNIAKFGREAERVKLWRVDGDISLSTWYELIHMFFRGNFTVPEYFGLDPGARPSAAQCRAGRSSRQRGGGR